MFSHRLRNAVSRGAQLDELMTILKEEGRFTPLEENCRRLVLEGTTTTSEVRRLIGASAEG